MKYWIYGFVVIAALVGILWLNGWLMIRLEKKQKAAAEKAGGTANPPDLAGVLQMARGLVAMPANSFKGAKWKTGDEAVAEIDTYIHQIVAKEPMDRGKLENLFATNGPIHKTAKASGWTDRYEALVVQFDYAAGVYKIT